MVLSKNLRIGVGLLALVIGVGTAWYSIVEEFGFLDGVFMAITTVTTVGYREVQPLDTSGRWFTITYILVGVGVMFYTAVALVEAAIAGEIAEALGVRRLSRRVHGMQEHIVLCGFGRVGEAIARELRGRGEQVLIIDLDSARREPAVALGCTALVGDATDESVLREAGVERARVLIAAADSDTGNTFITLTARALNPTLLIIARAGSQPAEQRLTTAGANRVVSPYRIAGRRIALAAIQPQLIDFAEGARGPNDTVNALAEVGISDGSGTLVGQTVREALEGFRSTRILGIERADGQLVVGPAVDTQLRNGDRLMLYGDQQEIEELAGRPVLEAHE